MSTIVNGFKVVDQSEDVSVAHGDFLKDGDFIADLGQGWSVSRGVQGDGDAPCVLDLA